MPSRFVIGGFQRGSYSADRRNLWRRAAKSKLMPNRPFIGRGLKIQRRSMPLLYKTRITWRDSLCLASSSTGIEDPIALRALPHAPLLDSTDEDYLDDSGDIGLKASTKNRSVYEVLRVDQEGKHRRIYVKRRELLRSHGMKPRDLRRIDPFWDRPQSTQSIVIKDSAFLVSLLGVRCLVTEERLLLFDPENEASRKLLSFVTPRLRMAAGKSLSAAYSLEKQALRSNGRSGRWSSDPFPTPFELEILEGILTVALSQLDVKLANLMKHAAKVLSAIPSEVAPLDLEQLRRTKQACVELKSKAEALREILEEILDDDDELTRLNLTSRPARDVRVRERERKRLQREQDGADLFQNTEDALAEMDDEEEEEREVEEVEEMLEYYMQRSAGIQSEAERVLAGGWNAVAIDSSKGCHIGARDLEESISVSLSARRFEVNRLELMLSMGSFAAALGAMISGIFGMNLRSNLEMSMVGFYGVTGLIVIGCFFIFTSLFFYTKRRRIV